MSDEWLYRQCKCGNVIELPDITDLIKKLKMRIKFLEADPPLAAQAEAHCVNAQYTAGHIDGQTARDDEIARLTQQVATYREHFMEIADVLGLPTGQDLPEQVVATCEARAAAQPKAVRLPALVDAAWKAIGHDFDGDDCMPIVISAALTSAGIAVEGEEGNAK